MSLGGERPATNLISRTGSGIRPNPARTDIYFWKAAVIFSFTSSETNGMI